MRLLVRGGTVLTMDRALGDLEGGEVLIEGGRIKAVGRKLDAAGAETIDAAGMLVIRASSTRTCTPCAPRCRSARR